MTFIHEEASFWPFLILTIALGGWCAKVAGRKFAASWRPFYMLPVVILVLAFGIRFLHYGLYNATLFSLHYFLVDYAFALAFAIWGYFTKRSELMNGLYPWAFKRYCLVGWRETKF
ncbi:MAG: hypothetical protein V4691_07425 [Pseudomonadota bacterium]